MYFHGGEDVVQMKREQKFIYIVINERRKRKTRADNFLISSLTKHFVYTPIYEEYHSYQFILVDENDILSSNRQNRPFFQFLFLFNLSNPSFLCFRIILMYEPIHKCIYKLSLENTSRIIYHTNLKEKLIDARIQNTQVSHLVGNVQKRKGKYSLGRGESSRLAADS